MASRRAACGAAARHAQVKPHCSEGCSEGSKCAGANRETVGPSMRSRPKEQADGAGRRSRPTEQADGGGRAVFASLPCGAYTTATFSLSDWIQYHIEYTRWKSTCSRT